MLKKFNDPRESVLEARCVKLAKESGWLARKLNGLGYASWPDRLFLAPTQACSLPTFFVEFKRHGEGATPLQAKMHEELRRRGYHVFVIDVYEAFVKLFLRAQR